MTTSKNFQLSFLSMSRPAFGFYQYSTIPPNLGLNRVFILELFFLSREEYRTPMDILFGTLITILFWFFAADGQAFSWIFSAQGAIFHHLPCSAASRFDLEFFSLRIFLTESTITQNAHPELQQAQHLIHTIYLFYFFLIHPTPFPLFTADC